MDELLSPGFLLALGQIIWINALLSGDNAVVIALACRGLPDNQKRIGILAGAAAAVLLRIIFTALIVVLLGIPYLKVIGAAALLWIAVDLLKPKIEGHAEIAESSSLLKAVGTIALADIIMSLDNVIAIAGAAHGDWRLIILGLLISVPLIVAGSALILKTIERFPAVVWLGAALLGFVAGEMLMSDAAVLERLGEPFVHQWERPVAVLAAIAVVGIGFFLVRRHRWKDGAGA